MTRASSGQAPRRVADLVVGALLGAATVAWAGWLVAVGAGVPEEALLSWLPAIATRQLPGDDPLVLPPWVLVALGVGVGVAGATVLAGVVQEARRRAGGGATAVAISDRKRSIAALVLSVGTGAFFSLIGSIMALAAAGAIPFESGIAPEMPWFLGGIGAFLALASLLLTYSSVYRWMGGSGVERAGRRRTG